jgi:hypothetical protein
MSFVQYGVHRTEAERAADNHRRDIEQCLKELAEWQSVILIALGIQIRSGATKATDAQLDNACAEYGKRFTAIRDYTSAYRLAAPAPNRYS